MACRQYSYVKSIVASVQIAIALVFGSTWAAAASEYRLRAGDVIEVSVAGLPQFSHRAPVQLDGSITIPTIGTLDVEGELLKDVRERIQAAFAGKLLTVYASDGRELTRTVEREDVSATVAQYAPIWVSGDVVRSGEQRFQPRMTVRQAIASAGGVRSSIMNGEIGQRYDPIPLQRDYIASWLTLASQAVRVWRLRYELGETAEFDRSSLPPAPVPEDALSRILALEKDIIALRQEDLRRERAFLERSAVLAEEQIRSLSERLELEKQGEIDDMEEYERLQGLLRKGHMTNMRVVDARRALLYSSTRRLQTAHALMQARKQLDEARRALEKLDDQRRLAIKESLQSAELKLAEEHARLRSIQVKLELARVTVPRESENVSRPSITLIRRSGASSVTFEASYDDEIEPGDIIEVDVKKVPVSTGNNLGAIGTSPPRYALETR
nr:MAG: hypothetical protein DIU57_05610 [Pseudomonadota bacterium]